MQFRDHICIHEYEKSNDKEFKIINSEGVISVQKLMNKLHPVADPGICRKGAMHPVSGGVQRGGSHHVNRSQISQNECR